MPDWLISQVPLVLATIAITSIAWQLYLHYSQRRHAPAINIDLSATHTDLSQKDTLLSITAKLHNPSQVRINLTTARCLVTRISPIGENTLQSVLNQGRQKHQGQYTGWPQANLHKSDITLKWAPEIERYLEPNERMDLLTEMVIPNQGNQTLRIYFGVQFPKRENLTWHTFITYQI